MQTAHFHVGDPALLHLLPLKVARVSLRVQSESHAKGHACYSLLRHPAVALAEDEDEERFHAVNPLPAEFPGVGGFAVVVRTASSILMHSYLPPGPLRRTPAPTARRPARIPTGKASSRETSRAQWKWMSDMCNRIRRARQCPTLRASRPASTKGVDVQWILLPGSVPAGQQSGLGIERIARSNGQLLLYARGVYCRGNCKTSLSIFRHKSMQFIQLFGR